MIKYTCNKTTRVAIIWSHIMDNVGLAWYNMKEQNLKKRRKKGRKGKENRKEKKKRKKEGNKENIKR